MLNRSAFALIVLGAAASTSLGQINYISQSREVNSATNDGFGGIPLNPSSIVTPPIAAPDFNPFNERSETVNGNMTGWSEQTSSLLSDRITFSGMTGGEIDSVTFGGQAWGSSILTTEFSLAAPGDFSFTLFIDTVIASQSTTMGSDALAHARLLDSSNTEIFSYVFNRFLTWGETYTTSGSLPAGSYTLEFDLVAGQAGGGHHQAVYSGQFVIPAAPTASLLGIAALGAARRKRR